MWRGLRGKLGGKTSLAVVVGMAVAVAALEFGGATGTTVASGDSTPTSTVAAFATRLPVGTAAKTKKLTRAQKLKKALKACEKDKQKTKRKKCEAAARKNYGKKRKGEKPVEKPSETPEEQPAEKPEETGESVEQELTKAKTVLAQPGAAQVQAGKTLFASNCAGCHGSDGHGAEAGPNLSEMPRAHSITGVIEQLISPEGGMPNFDKELTFEKKEAIADFVAVEVTKVTEEAH